MLGQSNPARELVVPELWLDQVEPPVEGGRIVPAAPTVKHVVVLGQTIAVSALLVPEVWLDQLAPPFVVARIVPLAPTAKHVIALGQATPASALPVPDVCAVHGEPFVVAWMLPPAPTAMQEVALGQATAPRFVNQPCTPHTSADAVAPCARSAAAATHATRAADLSARVKLRRRDEGDLAAGRRAAVRTRSPPRAGG